MQRRKELGGALEQLRSIATILEELQLAEEEAFENLPEGLQQSEQAETLSGNSEVLQTAQGNIEEAINELEQIE